MRFFQGCLIGSKLEKFIIITTIFQVQGKLLIKDHLNGCKNEFIKIPHLFTIKLKLRLGIEKKSYICTKTLQQTSHSIIKYLMHSLYNQKKDENDGYHQLFSGFY